MQLVSPSFHLWFFTYFSFGDWGSAENFISEKVIAESSLRSLFLFTRLVGLLYASFHSWRGFYRYFEVCWLCTGDLGKAWSCSRTFVFLPWWDTLLEDILNATRSWSSKEHLEHSRMKSRPCTLRRVFLIGLLQRSWAMEVLQKGVFASFLCF